MCGIIVPLYVRINIIFWKHSRTSENKKQRADRVKNQAKLGTKLRYKIQFVPGIYEKCTNVKYHIWYEVHTCTYIQQA